MVLFLTFCVYIALTQYREKGEKAKRIKPTKPLNKWLRLIRKCTGI